MKKLVVILLSVAFLGGCSANEKSDEEKAKELCAPNGVATFDNDTGGSGGPGYEASCLPSTPKN